MQYAAIHCDNEDHTSVSSNYVLLSYVPQLHRRP